MRVLIFRGLMIAMLALVVSNGVAFAGPLEDAQPAYDRGDYETALRFTGRLRNREMQWRRKSRIDVRKTDKVFRRTTKKQSSGIGSRLHKENADAQAISD